MRCNQVSIFIERFGDYVPKGYPADVQRISVYCDDSTSIFAALAKANAMAVNELNEYETIGVRSYVSSNEYSRADYREMHGANPKEKSNYDDDLELQFTYKAHELRKDRIWVQENLDEILQLIRSIEDKKTLKCQLKEKFGLNDFQIRKLLSIRLDMLSKDDYLSDIEENKTFEIYYKNRCESGDIEQRIRWYERRLRDAQRKADEYRTYIIIAENYHEMIEIISEKPNFSDYAGVFRDKYGFDINQVRLVKAITIEDLVSKEKYQEKIKEIEDSLKFYSSELEELKKKRSAE